MADDYVDESRIYWLAHPKADKVVAAADERVQAFYDHVNSAGFLDLWRASNRACFAGFYTGGELGKVGKQGEFRTVEVNDYGNLHQHLFTMVTSQKPAFEARTETADAQAQQQAPVGVAVAETAWSEKGLRAVSLGVADTMIRAGEAYALKRWDPMAGPVYTTQPKIDPETGAPALDEQGQPVEEPVPGGDVEYRLYHPLDVARDWTRPANEQRWHIPRRRANRWDLAAQHPPLTEKILGAPSILEERRRPMLVNLTQWSNTKDCDDVWVYDLVVDRSPALPEGRLTSYITPDCILFDGPLPYRERPLYRAAPKEMEGTAFGYSLMWDVLAPQIALNNLLSTITTAASNLGLPTVWQPTGDALNRSNLQGITILQGGTTPPQVLDLMNISPELFKLVDLFTTAMERLSGVNAIARGQTADGQKGLSGAAYALFAARAIEFASRFQDAYNTFLEQIASGTIYDYQDMGAGEYLVTLAGEGNGYRVTSFLGGKDEQPGKPSIGRVSKMSVRLSNPLQATTAGKMAMFDSLKEIPNAITSPEQAIQVMTTGKVDPATKATQRELEAIQRENEMLGKGEPARALRTDRFWIHIPEHLSVVATPEARANPDSPQVLATLAHVEEHEAMVATLSPAQLALMGAPPDLVQMLMATMAPPPVPGATTGTPPGAPGEASMTEPPPPGMGEVPGMPSLPQMPTDPVSGQQMPMPGGAA